MPPSESTSDADTRSSSGDDRAARPKTILLPTGDRKLQRFVAESAPIPVSVVSNPSAPLRSSDLALLVVEDADPALRAAATRVITEGVSYVVLIRRDVWSGANDAVRKLLDEVQGDPKHKLIRFWRDREELEQTIRTDVFGLDDIALKGQSVTDGSFVKAGTAFEQAWVLENTGFCAWESRRLRMLATDHLAPHADEVEIPFTAPGSRVTVTVSFTAPAEPASCRSVWQVVDAGGRLSFPWAPGLWCQTLAVY